MTSTLPVIKQATTNDLLILKDLSISTFTESYVDYNTPDNMELYTNQYFSLSNLQTELADALNHFAIAFVLDEPAGYIKLRPNKEPMELKGVNAIEMERIYVSQKYQGQKIGAALMSYAINWARQNSFNTLWLGVWEHNTKAQLFYSKWGFQPFGEHDFLLGKDVQTDLLLKIPIVDPNPKPNFI